jgi:hypothetical protein
MGNRNATNDRDNSLRGMPAYVRQRTLRRPQKEANVTGRMSNTESRIVRHARQDNRNVPQSCSSGEADSSFEGRLLRHGRQDTDCVAWSVIRQNTDLLAMRL